MLDGFNKANTTARGFLRPILTMNSLYHRDAMQILCYITCTLTMYLYRSEYIFSICKFMKYVLYSAVLLLPIITIPNVTKIIIYNCIRKVYSPSGASSL